MLRDIEKKTLGWQNWEGKKVTMAHGGVFQMMGFKDLEVQTLMVCWSVNKPKQYPNGDCRAITTSAITIWVTTI